jgi:hypothetical protein
MHGAALLLVAGAQAVGAARRRVVEQAGVEPSQSGLSFGTALCNGHRPSAPMKSENPVLAAGFFNGLYRRSAARVR